MRKIEILTAAAVVAFAGARAQIAPDYYSKPMEIPILLSANFGELRANHFHAGVDIKTQGVEGHKVLAAAEGYISRAGIAPGGYGKALYITHPNGTTTVYAHLKSFMPAVERYVDDWRYANRKHSGDVFFTPSQFPVGRGEQIGLSGNTGMSGGPHLHFEVRDAAQQPTNIVARDYLTVRDDIPPRILRLYCVGTDTLAGVPLGSEPRAIEVTQTAPGRYTVPGTVEIPHGCYFIVETTDRKNDVANKFGIHNITERVDGRTHFELTIDKFPFDKTRYKHAVSYYPLQRKSSGEVFRLAVMEGNRLTGMYGTVRNRGVITSAFGQRRDIEISVTDDSGNTSTLSFAAQAPSSPAGRPCARSVAEDTPIIYYNRPFRYSADGAVVSIPEGALYESVFYDRSVSGEESAVYRNLSAVRRLYAPVYTVGSYDIPMQKSMTLSIAADAPEELRSRLCLAYVNAAGKMSSAGGTWNEGRVTGSVRNMGRYTVVADTVPPRIVPSFASGADLRGAKRISFKITDDFAGVWDFQGTIDGKWILFEWNILQARIVHNFDAERFDFAGKTHEIRLKVTDGRGNERVWEGTFIK